MRHFLKEKFKKLKSVLKGGNQEVYGEIETKINLLVQIIKALEVKSESGVLPVKKERSINGKW
jgi:hypothetical protein